MHKGFNIPIRYAYDKGVHLLPERKYIFKSLLNWYISFCVCCASRFIMNQKKKGCRAIMGFVWI